MPGLAHIYLQVVEVEIGARIAAKGEGARRREVSHGDKAGSKKAHTGHAGAAST